jgi:nitroreductase
MPAFLDLLKTRRSVAPRFMTGCGPAPEQLHELLTIGARVPDHGRLVPWRFIVFEGEARQRADAIIADVFRTDNPDADVERQATESNRLSRAPLVVAVVSTAAPHVKIPEWEQVLSAGAVCMNVSIAAKAMGFSACWLTEWYAYDRRVLDALGIGPNERVAGFIHVGQSDMVPNERDRPDLGMVVTRF